MHYFVVDSGYKTVTKACSFAKPIPNRPTPYKRIYLDEGVWYLYTPGKRQDVLLTIPGKEPDRLPSGSPSFIVGDLKNGPQFPYYDYPKWTLEQAQERISFVKQD